MKINRTVLPLVATGGVAAVLFGGAAVHTAFTSSATGSFHAATARVGTQLTNGTVSLTNAVPGDVGPTSNVTITNNGSTPETISVGFGAGSNAALDKVVDVIWDGQDAGSIASLANTAFPLSNATLAAKGAPGDSVTIPVALMLESTADDSVDNAASDVVSFTVTGTATSAAGNTGGSTPTPSPTQSGWDINQNNKA
jgi:archaellum component FlaF (FlaF/FlaG flagellin family)